MSAVGSRLMKVKIGATEFSAQCSALAVAARDVSGPVTFQEAADGGAKEWVLRATVLQDPESTSLWTQAWSNAGSTVAVVVNPHGVDTFAAATPGMVGNVIIMQPGGDFLGGEADSATSVRRTWTLEWPFTAKPTLDTSSAF